MAKKKKRKVPLRTQLRRLHKKADKAISEFVRATTAAEYNGKCPLCNQNPVECCFHFVRRRRKVLRWDLRNLVGACHSCNYQEYRNPDPSRAWYIRKHGVEQYLSVVDKSAESFEPTIEYLQGIVDRFTAEMESIKRFHEDSNETQVAPKPSEPKRPPA